jgi:hypothetical protein
MSRAASSSRKKTYGVVRVTRDWELARSSFYYQQEIAAKLLLDHRVAALRAERDLNRIRQNVDATQNRLTRILTSYNLFCHKTSPSWVIERSTSSKALG